MKKNSEQQAFPTNLLQPFHSGLTKREHFAGLAMQGLLAYPQGVFNDKGKGSTEVEDIIRVSILHADELLKQLEEKETSTNKTTSS